ncbi:MAG: NAD-dependent deacetylase [Lachnospiraceae bacterium]|nr:NAD-dependent deacetylase [Lachnospiraceae bacterium]
MEQNLEMIKNIIKNGSNIVILGGIEVMMEAGLNGVRAEHIAYDIEQKYGYSNDDIVSSLFFSRRVDIFYDYYKEIILNKEKLEPTSVHEDVAKLQRYGKVDTVITRMVYSLYQKAGCDRVIELHGSVEQNRCPACGKIFGQDYIRNAKNVPLCDTCNVPLRPGFALLGEMIDNGKITQASCAVERANILMVLGASIRSPLCRYIIKYYSGDKVILLNKEEAPGDDRADYRAYGNVGRMFHYIADF